MTQFASVCRGLCRVLAIVAWLGLPAASVHAQAGPARALGGAGVTQETIEDLLAIPDPKASGEQRGFRPAKTGTKPKRFGPGRANLLVTFVTGSAELAPEAKSLLDTLARAMQSDTLAGVSFRILGHADARGVAADNDALSLARARAVAAYLSGTHGILADRLKAEGRGSREPMNRQRIDAAENRRVTIVSLRG
jgi:outer membrane protein OmpA-like peptidoglycan-associated protein